MCLLRCLRFPISCGSVPAEEEEEVFVGSAFTVGRQDFSIRSMDPLTGKERWNVTYSRLGIGGSPAIASTGGSRPCRLAPIGMRHARYSRSSSGRQPRGCRIVMM